MRVNFPDGTTVKNTGIEKHCLSIRTDTYDLCKYLFDIVKEGKHHLDIFKTLTSQVTMELMFTALTEKQKSNFETRLKQMPSETTAGHQVSSLLLYLNLEGQLEEMVMLAVRRMLPKNRLSRQVIKKLKVYKGAEHPHMAQVK